MAITSSFAQVPAAGPEFSQDSPICVYSFDLGGNVMEMNAAMAGILGYAREEVLCMNLSQLLEPESWTSSRDQIVAQLGGDGPRQVNITAIARDGRRIPLAVVRAAKIPITATSANLSGEIECTTAEAVQIQLQGRISLIVDGGKSPRTVSSTIVHFREDGTWQILREGAIPAKDIVEALS